MEWVLRNLNTAHWRPFSGIHSAFENHTLPKPGSLFWMESKNLQRFTAGKEEELCILDLWTQAFKFTFPVCQSKAATNGGGENSTYSLHNTSLVSLPQGVHSFCILKTFLWKRPECSHLAEEAPLKFLVSAPLISFGLHSHFLGYCGLVTYMVYLVWPSQSSCKWLLWCCGSAVAGTGWMQPWSAVLWRTAGPQCLEEQPTSFTLCCFCLKLAAFLQKEWHCHSPVLLLMPTKQKRVRSHWHSRAKSFGNSQSHGWLLCVWTELAPRSTHRKYL